MMFSVEWRGCLFTGDIESMRPIMKQCLRAWEALGASEREETPRPVWFTPADIDEKLEQKRGEV